MTFEEFSEINRRRCESYNGFGESLQEESKYTLEHWAMSIAAEAGEICDAILGWRGLKASRAGETKDDIAKELADVITYCDLALQKLGYSTGEMLAKKFNEVNERCGFGTRFALAASPALQPAPVAYARRMCVEPECASNPPHEHHAAAPQLIVPAEPRGMDKAAEWARMSGVPAEPRACRRCSECQGAQHHWIPNEEEGAGVPDYACKHCDVGYAWMCIDCDEPLGEPDAMCAACSNEGDDDRSEA